MYGQVSFGKSNPSCRLRLGIGKVKLGKKPVRLKLALSGLFMFLQPVQCSLYFLYSQEKERKIKRNSFLFFPFHCNNIKVPKAGVFFAFSFFLSSLVLGSGYMFLVKSGLTLKRGKLLEAM